MEGFYYFIATGCIHEDLRLVHGLDAKKLGKQYPRVFTDDFHDILFTGLEWKILCTPDVVPYLCSSTMPFVHYYVYTSKDSDRYVVKVPKDGWWLTEGWAHIRWKFNVLVDKNVDAYKRAWGK